MLDLEMIICGVPEVDHYIDDADLIISIMNPGYTIFAPQSILAKEDENRHSVLRLEFDDTWSEVYKLGEEIVTKDIIYDVIDFVSTHYENADNPLTLLIHCHEGVSRSTAMAIAVYTAIFKDYREAISTIANVRSQAVPNIEIVRLSDEIFGLNGKLIDAIWEEFYH
jgi:predicted protein tyrosine phosphatase